MQPPARFRPPVTTAYRSSRHETSEWQVTWQDQLQKPRPRDDARTSRWSRRGGCQYLFFVTTAVIGRVSDAELACCARASDEAAPALVAAVLAAGVARLAYRRPESQRCRQGRERVAHAPAGRVCDG